MGLVVSDAAARSPPILWDWRGKCDLLGSEPEQRAPDLRVDGAASSREDHPHILPESASRRAAGRRAGRAVMASRPGASAWFPWRPVCSPRPGDGDAGEEAARPAPVLAAPQSGAEAAGTAG